MAALGGMGIGLVWGWLAGTVDVGRRWWADALSLAAATAVLSLFVMALGGGAGAAACLAAAAFSCLVHLGWRTALRARMDCPGGRR